MTLAAIFLVSIFYTLSAQPPAAAPVHPVAQQQTPADKTSGSAGATGQSGAAPESTTPPKATPSTSAPAQTTSGQTPQTTAKRRRKKKKATSTNCASVPTNDPATASGTPPGSAPKDPARPQSETASGTGATTPCPPPKVIVRQGGTSDPSIQLAGGAVGDQAAQQRDTANQMLEATEANLKKLSEAELSANQQDMVKQVRQFMEQSKSAVKASDFERARTLAWKAQLLSEELTKPEK
jgi:hypothetical protein